MPQVVFSKKFKKQYAKLPAKVRRQFDLRYELWCEDPANPVLRVHRLKGKLANFYSMDVTGDVRAIYEDIDGTLYLYAMIGSHSELYG